jgi:putative flippase GtrA
MSQGKILAGLTCNASSELCALTPPRRFRIRALPRDRMPTSAARPAAVTRPMLPAEDLSDEERRRPTPRGALRHPWRALSQVLRHWAGLSTILGSVSTVFDLGLVILLVQVFHFNPAAAAPIGVFFGSSVNFTLNRLFAFRDSRGHVALQAMRYFIGTVVAASVHAGVVYLLTNRLHLYYVLSKFVADILVFTGGNLLLFRYLVFPKTHGHKG